MGRAPAVSGAMTALRWGLILLLGATALVVLVPGLLAGSEVTVLGERAPVRAFPRWSLPALDVGFSMPPTAGETPPATWAAEQLATAVYGLAVVVYYAGLAGMVVGLLLLGVAVRRLSRSADALRR